jgi:glycosyltransferase involved in cell wall biosynthesis
VPEDRPLISVLTPTYDSADFVGEAIESVLAQTYRPLELVVVDDCSTDDTVAIVERYAQRHPELRLVRFRERAGPCRRRNDALAHASGGLLAWLDADDVWEPRKLERQTTALAADPGVGFAYSDYAEIDEAGATLPSPWPHRLESGDVLGSLFVHGCFPCSSSVLIRRDAMARRRLRFLDTDFSFGDDYFLWLALSLDWRAACVPEPLVRYRRHARNESRRRTDVNFDSRRLALLAAFLDEFPEARARLGATRRRGFAHHSVRAARFELRRGRLPRAGRHGLRALAWSPVEVARAVGRVARHGLAWERGG